MLLREPVRQLDVDRQPGDTMLLLVPLDVHLHGETVGRDPARVAVPLDVDARAGGDRGQEQVERLGSGPLAARLGGLVGIHALSTRELHGHAAHRASPLLPTAGLTTCSALTRPAGAASPAGPAPVPGSHRRARRPPDGTGCFT